MFEILMTHVNSILSARMKKKLVHIMSDLHTLLFLFFFPFMNKFAEEKPKIATERKIQMNVP